MIVAIGYLASLFLAISLMVNNTLKFRWLSTGGQIAFIIYGVLIGAFPIIIANSVLLCINAYQLIKLYRYNEAFQLVTISKENNIVRKFITYHQKDITNYFPDFVFIDDANKVCFVVLRDMVISNLFVARLSDDGNAVVEINYTVANFRDFKVGRFLFDKEKEYLIERGVKQIVYEKIPNKSHLQFIRVMGFVEQTIDGKICWVKQLA